MTNALNTLKTERIEFEELMVKVESEDNTSDMNEIYVKEEVNEDRVVTTSGPAQTDFQLTQNRNPACLYKRIKINDKKLIKLVQNYPVLFDLTHPKYMDTEYKNTLWNKIGEEMKTAGPSCKTRWFNIRDNFRRSWKKNKIVNGQKVRNVQPYKYADQLDFLKKVFEGRETRTYIDDEVMNQSYTCEDEDSASCENQENTQDSTTEVKSNNSIQADSNQCSSTPRKIAKEPAPNVTTPQTADVIEYLFNKHGSTGSGSLQPHPVDAFLAGVAPALKKLPPHYWHYAKADIFAAVQRYEFKMLMDQHQIPESSHR